MRLIHIIQALISGMLCGMVANGPVTAQSTINIHGSDTMLILNRDLATEYKRLKPSVKIKVVGGGSGLGIAALLEGKVDIAAASRAMKKKEKAAFEKMTGKPPQEIVVALDGIGVYVHNNNPVGRLTISQLARILSGDIRNWKDVGGLNRTIDIYNRDRYSGTRAFIRKHVLGDNSFSDLAHEVSTTAMLTSCVSRNQSAIGYGGIAYSQGSHIIRLAVGASDVGVWPSMENVSTGKYPLSRPLFFYVNQTSANEELRAFIEWVLSPPGQDVVTSVGYYPAPRRIKAPRNNPGGEASPLMSHEPIMLTPENMQRYGFHLEVSCSEAKGAVRRGQTMVTMRFNPAGSSIQKILTLSIRIGDCAVIPLALDHDHSVRFSLRKALIRTSTICIGEVGVPRDGAFYVVQLGAFSTG